MKHRSKSHMKHSKVVISTDTTGLSISIANKHHSIISFIAVPNQHSMRSEFCFKRMLIFFNYYLLVYFKNLYIFRQSAYLTIKKRFIHKKFISFYHFDSMFMYSLYIYILVQIIIGLYFWPGKQYDHNY